MGEEDRLQLPVSASFESEAEEGAAVAASPAVIVNAALVGVPGNIEDQRGREVSVAEGLAGEVAEGALGVGGVRGA